MQVFLKFVLRRIYLYSHKYFIIIKCIYPACCISHTYFFVCFFVEVIVYVQSSIHSWLLKWNLNVALFKMAIQLRTHLEIVPFSHRIQDSACLVSNWIMNTYFSINFHFKNVYASLLCFKKICIRWLVMKNQTLSPWIWVPMEHHGWLIVNCRGILFRACTNKCKQKIT